jgi:4-alpha-glucanotransferase
MTAMPEDLERLTQAAGLSLDWRDAMGRDQRVTPEVARRVLAELGLPAESAGDIAASLEQLRVLGQGTPPLCTAVQGQPVELPVAATGREPVIQIELESGGGFAVSAERIGECLLRLPPVNEPGYHTLRLDGEEHTLAVAPARCYSVQDALGQATGREGARGWAPGVQLYSLRRSASHAAASGSGGFGDFTALSLLAERAAARGAAAVAVSPVHAMYSARPEHYSPYAPSSRLFINALYVDPAAVFGRDALSTVMALGLGEEFERLERLDLIDWPNAGRAKLAVLRALYERFPGNVGGRVLEDFEIFRRKGGPQLEDHARFEAIQAWRIENLGDGSGWRDWPIAFGRPDSPEVAEFAARHEHEVRFHVFLQWLAARGMGGAHEAARRAGMPIGLISDLAVGTDPAGSHAWSRQGEVLATLSPGAPPDVFNVKGQAWGLTAFSPSALKARGYRAFIEMLRASLAYAGGVRIDHALGLQRMWLVPQGATPMDGAYVRYPFDDMIRLIALESSRRGAVVIGENLGTVPDGFNARIADAGMLGMEVLWFVRDGDWAGAPFWSSRDWSPASIATTTTHDLPTVTGWWAGRDVRWHGALNLLPEGRTEPEMLERRRQDKERLWQDFGHAGLVPPDTPAPEQAPVDTALDFVSRSPGPLMVAPMEDLLGLEEQPNLPGTIAVHPNWRRRLPALVEDLFDAPEVAARAAILKRRGESG